MNEREKELNAKFSCGSVMPHQRIELERAITNCLNWKDTGQKETQNLPIDILLKRYFGTFEIDIE